MLCEFHKILRIIYEKRDFKEKRSSNGYACLLIWMLQMLLWYMRENVFKIFRKTYISENIHKLHKHNVYISRYQTAQTELVLNVRKNLFKFP